MLLFEYIKRVKQPLALASSSSLLLLSLSFPTIIGSLGLLYYGVAYLVARTLIMKLYEFVPQFQHRETTRRLLEILALLSPILVFTAFPHVFLFFNALPFIAAFGLIGLFGFIIPFEMALKIPSLDLGQDYSLIHILLNPISSIRRLRCLLNSDEEKFAKLLLPADAKTALIARQAAALSNLSEHNGAIIHDIALYDQELAKLCHGKTPVELKKQKYRRGNTLLQDLQSEALYNALTEVQKLEDAYLVPCTPEQKILYKKYRELARSLNLPHAACAISSNELKDSSPADFIILEKRVRVNDVFKTADNKTRFYHYQNGFLPLFNRTYVHPLGTKKLPPADPADRDPFFLPGGPDTQYRYHFYTSVLGHGLSLQLCETIEALNLSFKPALTAQQTTAQLPTSQSAAPNNPSYLPQTRSGMAANLNATLIAYRNTPPSSVSIVNQSIYGTNTPYPESLYHNDGQDISEFFNNSSGSRI